MVRSEVYLSKRLVLCSWELYNVNDYVRPRFVLFFLALRDRCRTSWFLQLS